MDLKTCVQIALCVFTRNSLLKSRYEKQVYISTQILPPPSMPIDSTPLPPWQTYSFFQNSQNKILPNKLFGQNKH